MSAQINSYKLYVRTYQRFTFLNVFDMEMELLGTCQRLEVLICFSSSICVSHNPTGKFPGSAVRWRQRTLPGHHSLLAGVAPSGGF